MKTRRNKRRGAGRRICNMLGLNGRRGSVPLELSSFTRMKSQVRFLHRAFILRELEGALFRFGGRVAIPGSNSEAGVREICEVERRAA